MFVEFLSCLPVQVPAIATVLALISKATPETAETTDPSENAMVEPSPPAGLDGAVFVNEVMNKLAMKFTSSWSTNDVLTCKIILRSWASMFNCHCLEEASFLDILYTLLNIATTGCSERSGSSGSGIILTDASKSAIYLLGTVIPWCIQSLIQTATGKSILENASTLFAHVASTYQSPFSSTGVLAIFHLDNINQIDEEDEDDADMTAGNTSVGSHSKRINIGPLSGSVCWDTLWEVASMCRELIQQTAQTLAADASNSTAVTPLTDIMLAPWTQCTDVLPVATTLVSLQQTPVLSYLQTILTDQQQQQQPLSTIDYGADSWLQPCYSIFDVTSSEPAKVLCLGLSSLEKYLLKDYYRDVLHFFNPVVREDGTREGTLETLAAQLNSLGKLFPVQRDVKYLEYILIEILLINLTTVYVTDMTVHSGDSSSHQLLYANHRNRYGLTCRLLLELCKSYHTIPPILALGVSVLFQYGSDVDSTVWRHQLGAWLAFHLVNTKMSWPYWSHWAQELQTLNKHIFGATSSNETAADTEVEEADINYEGVLFIKLVLDRCARRVVRQHLLEALPLSAAANMGVLHDALPSLTEGPYCPLLQSAQDMTVDTAEGDGTNNNTSEIEQYAKALYQMIEERVDSDELDEWLENTAVLSKTQQNDEHTNNNWKIEILLQCISHAGRATLANTTALLDRYADTLRLFAESAEEQKVSDRDSDSDIYSVAHIQTNTLPSL